MADALISDMPAEAETGGWYLEPKDRDPASEFDRQLAVLRLVKNLAPSIDVIAIPNAGKSTDWQRVRRWREGAKAGALDLFFTWKPTRPGDRGVFFAEMKDGREMPTREQCDQLNLLRRQGHHCGVYRTADLLIAHLRAAGAPFL